MVKELRRLMPDRLINEVAKTKETPQRIYRELIGEKQLVYTSDGKPQYPWNSAWMHAEYIRCTDGVIGKIDGTIPLKNVTVYSNGHEERRTLLTPPDEIIWLDKSARPVAWLMRELWPILARTPGEEFRREATAPKRPPEHFLNIDKDDWLRRMGIPGHQIQNANLRDIDLTKIDRDHLTRIRALYSVLSGIDEDSLDERIWESPTIFDGKHVMVIDEVESSGKTLLLAQLLLSSAIPDATFSGQYWSEPGKAYFNHGNITKGDDTGAGKQEFAARWVPIWYDPKSSLGRGIGNREFDWPENAGDYNKAGMPAMLRDGKPVMVEQADGEQKIVTRYNDLHVSAIAKIGRHILSTQSHYPDDPSLPDNEVKKYRLMIDTKAEHLRQDFKLLADDLRNGNVLYNPSMKRDMDDTEARITAFYGNVATWRARKVAIEPKTLL